MQSISKKPNQVKKVPRNEFAATKAHLGTLTVVTGTPPPRTVVKKVVC